MYFYLRRANLVSQGHLAFEQRLYLYAKYSKYKTISIITQTLSNITIGLRARNPLTSIVDNRHNT